MIPDYTYPGQWFDDMGAIAFAIKPSPVLGFDLATTAGLTRTDLMNIATSVRGSGVDPYSTMEM